MPVTKISVPVTSQLAVFVGSLTRVTVRTAVPAARAVTAPVAETLAFAASELSKVTLLSVASAGITPTCNSWTALTCKVKAAGATVMPSRGLAVAVTVMTQAAVFVGSLTLFTVTVAWPTMALAFTNPLASTVAMSSAEEVHITGLSVVFSGVKTAFRRNSSFTSKEAEAGLTPRAVKGTGTADTVTAQAAYLEEFDLETAVMVTVPGDFPVTTPSATEAMSLSFEVHIRDLSASAGVMTGVSVTVAFIVTEAVAGSVMLSTDTPSTVTSHLAVFVWSLTLVAVMVTVPIDFPVTVPSATVAMLLSLEFHVRDLSAAFSGVTEAVSFAVSSTFTDTAEGEIVTPSTAIGSSFFLQEEIRRRVTEETRSRAAKAISKFFIAVCLKVKCH